MALSWWSKRRGTADLGDPVVTVLLVALASLCLLGTGVAAQRAIDERDRLDRLAADRASDVLSAELQTSIAALNGADAIAGDGEVTEADFVAFANDVVANAALGALAYSERITGDQRATWEATTGRVVQEFAGPGELRSASRRDEYVVVRSVHPVTETSQITLGLDLASDPVRLTGLVDAAEADGPVVVAPIALAGTGGVGLFVAKAVVHGGRVVGFVSSGVGVDALMVRIDPEIAATLTIRLEDVVLRTGSDGGETASFTAGGRSFTVRADDPTGLDLTLPTIGAVATVLVAVATTASWGRDRRARREHLATSERNASLGALAEELADAATSVDAARLVALRAAGIAGATRCTVAVVDVTDPDRLVVIDGSINPGDSAAALPATSEATDGPTLLAEVIRTATTLVVTSDGGTLPAGAPAPIGGGTDTVLLCVPLHTAADSASGALALWWPTPTPPHRLEILRADAQAVAEVAGRALERILVREIIRGGVEQVGEIARALTAAHTPADVEAIVEGRRVARLLDVDAVHLDPEATPDAEGQHTFPLPSAGRGGAQIRVELAADRLWTPMRHALVQTIVELTDGAWRRARQHQQEHSVVERLQIALLAPPPPVAHLDIAVRYQSAMDTIGIGGDWFSVIDHADATFLVIGDVTGHGPDAVALMSEVKTILRHLFSSGSTIAEALAHADQALIRRNGFASATVIRSDKRSHRAEVVNAGHPYPLLRDRDGCRPIAVTHRPLLGLRAGDVVPTVVPYLPGDTVVMYTDGLVERRGIGIDDCIEDLRARVVDLPPEELVDRLLAERLTQRDGSIVRDDMALIVARRIADIGTDVPG